MTVKEAAAYYAKVVKPYNTAILKTAWNKYGKRTTLASQRKYYAMMAKASDTFINALKARTWPTVAAADIRALLKQEIVFQHRALVTSRSKTLLDLLANARSTVSANDKGADLAAIVRDDLGLPPNG